VVHGHHRAAISEKAQGGSQQTEIGKYEPVGGDGVEGREEEARVSEH
jgi:hypothetical protein